MIKRIIVPSVTGLIIIGVCVAMQRLTGIRWTDYVATVALFQAQGKS